MNEDPLETPQRTEARHSFVDKSSHSVAVQIDRSGTRNKIWLEVIVIALLGILCDRSNRE